jgi:hypothetical protein
MLAFVARPVRDHAGETLRTNSEADDMCGGSGWYAAKLIDATGELICAYAEYSGGCQEIVLTFRHSGALFQATYFEGRLAKGPIALAVGEGKLV